MPNIKVVLWSAGSGAVIALIAALFGRVGFFDLILRSLIGGAAFALLGAGMSILLMRFIPELFELGEAEENDFAVTSSGTGAGSGVDTGAEEPAARRGNNLNIVLDGDEYNYASEEGSEDAAGGAAVSGSDLSRAELSDAEEVSESEDVDDEFVEEIDDTGPRGGSIDDSEYQSSTQAQASSQPQQKTQEKSNAGPGSRNTSSEYQEFEDLSDVDTLPDLEEFTDSFESVAASQESENGTINNGGGYSSNDSVDIMGDQQDPATVAKAVRTIIGKDQEG